MASGEMLTAKSRTQISTSLPAKSVGRVTRSQSRNLSDSEDAHAPLHQGRQKRRRTSHSNGLGTAIAQARRSKQSTNARVRQEDMDALSSIAEDSEIPNSNSSVSGDPNNSHSHGYPRQNSEPPGASSTNSVVTARTSHSAQQLTDLDKELIVDMLPSLSIASAKVLDLLAPADATPADLQNLSENLKSPDSRISIRLRALRGAFESVRQTYGTDHYINISLIHKALYGVQDLDGLREDLNRPDPILQKANLVNLVITVLTSTPSSEHAPTLQHLDAFFPRPFLSTLASTPTSISESSAGSALLRETFEVGLEIRTRLAIALLDIHQEESSYDPESIILQLFFGDADAASSDDGVFNKSLHPMKVRGWAVTGLGGAEPDLSAAMKDTVIQRVNLICSHIHRRPKSAGTDKYIDFEALDSLFPWTTFVSKVIMWARFRVNEIEKHLRSSGGAESIENALKTLVQRESPFEDLNINVPNDAIPQKEAQTISSQVLGERSNPATRDKARFEEHSRANDHMAEIPKKFDSPNSVARLKRREMQLASRESLRSSVRPTSHKGQLSHDDRNAGIASSSNLPDIASPEARLRGSSMAPSNNPNQADLRGQQSDDWAPQDVEEDDRPYVNQAIDSQLPPDSSAGVLQSLSRQHQEQEKENLPRETRIVLRKKARFFNETQEGAERVSFDDDESDEQTSRAVEQAQHRARTQDAGDDEDFEETSDEEFQLDGRLVDESRKNASRRRPRQGENASNQSPGQSERRPGDDALQQNRVRTTGEEPSDTEAAREENQHSPTASDRISHARVNRVAKSTVASQTSHKVQVRRPWEEAATSRLIELIEDDDFGTSWAKIAKLNDPLLEGRGQVALKDKARNIKLDFLKARIALPVHFEDVRLNRNQIQILHDLGIDYQQDPERGTA